jgi:hypothetical protein
MKTLLLAFAGCVAAAALSGCATHAPITSSDRALMPTVAEVFPTLPKSVHHTESLEKRRWPDGTVELSYTFRARHNSLPILLYSSIGDFPSPEAANDARAEADRSHNRLLMSLEQREANAFIPAGPNATTHLLFAGVLPVGLRFSTTIDSKAFAFVCLAPPQFFRAHRAADAVRERVDRLNRVHLKP